MTYQASTIDDTLRGFRENRVKLGQIDFNGVCNSKCWYCPVKYEGNIKSHMVNTSLEDVETILSKIKNSRIIDTDFIYTSNYNEFVLHPELEGILELFRKFKYRTMILSNGTTLNKGRVDTLLRYPDVVVGMCLNIPDIEKSKWARKTGFSENVHNTLMNNLEYLNDVFPSASIQINSSKYDVTAPEFVGSDCEHERIVYQMKTLFPRFQNISVLGWLSDRAGRLSEMHGVMRDKGLPKNRIATGCNHSMNDGGRIYGWFHVNSKGELFICCDDYEMKYTFGNLLKQDFDDAWLSIDHAIAVRTAQSSLCLGCSAAI